MHICPVCTMAVVLTFLGLKAYFPVIKAKMHQHRHKKHEHKKSNRKMKMKRGQVIVRGANKEGKSRLVDVLDLDDESFRAYVVDRLICGGLVIPSNKVASLPIRYKERADDV